MGRKERGVVSGGWLGCDKPAQASFISWVEEGGGELKDGGGTTAGGALGICLLGLTKPTWRGCPQGPREGKTWPMTWSQRSRG